MVSKASVVQWLGFHPSKVEVRVRFTAVANLFSFFSGSLHIFYFCFYFSFLLLFFISFLIFKDPLRDNLCGFQSWKVGVILG
jgi:hypothetical protein